MLFQQMQLEVERVYKLPNSKGHLRSFELSEVEDITDWSITLLLVWYCTYKGT